MSIVSNPLLLKKKATTSSDFTLERAARFDFTDQNKLDRLVQGKGNCMQWTASWWMKRAELTKDQRVMTRYATGKECFIKLGDSDDDQIFFRNKVGNTEYDAVTTQHFRDPSAWMHIVFIYDSPNDTATDRYRLYVNGERADLTFNHNDKCPQFGVSGWNGESSGMRIGKDFGGYLSDFYFVDGLCLDPLSFAGPDTSGNWNPRAFTLHAPNNGTTWSDSLSAYNDAWGVGGSYPKSNVFDGKGTTVGGLAAFHADNFVKFEPSSAFTGVDRFEVYIDHTWTEVEYRLKSGTTWGDWQIVGSGANVGWEDCSKYIVDREVSGFEMQPTTGNVTRLYIGGFRVNGVLLVDGKTDPTTRNNPANGTSWQANGSSSNVSSSNPIYQAFDMNHTTYTDSQTTGNGDTWSYTLPSSLTINEGFRVYTNGDNAGDSLQFTIGGTVRNVTSLITRWMNVPYTGALTTIGGTRNSSGAGGRIYALEVDGHRVWGDSPGIVDNSFHLKLDKGANKAELGIDSFVEDDKPLYQLCETSEGQKNPIMAFNGTATDANKYNGPNGGGIGVFDFSTIGGISYSSKVELYADWTNSGQYDMFRINGGSWVHMSSGDNNGWGWGDILTGSGTLNTFEIRDSTSNSNSGSAEGAFSGLRVDGTVLVGRDGNNFTPYNFLTTAVGSTNYSTEITATSDEHASYPFSSIFDGDDETYGAITVTHGNSFHITFTPSTAIACTSSLKVKHYARSGIFDTLDIAVNDGSDIDVSDNASAVISDVFSGVTGNQITKIKFHGTYDGTNAGGELPGIYYIEVDGTKLTYLGGEHIDSLVDTPTNYGEDTGAGGEVRGNYCTLNPLASNSGTFGQGNLQYKGANTWGVTLATMAYPKTGKWYIEAEHTGANSGSSHGNITAWFGISKTQNLDYATWANTNTFTIHDTGHYSNFSTSSSGTITKPANGDVYGIIWDADARKISIFRNNTVLLDEIDLTSNISTSDTVLFATGSYYSFQGWQDFNFGQRAFKYNRGVTESCKTLCTQNLPDTFSGDAVNNPSKYFDVRLWSGNSVSGSKIRGLKFEPDMVWIKRRDSTGNQHVFDKVRGAEWAVYPDTDSYHYQDNSTLTAFNADGFTVGNAAVINGGGTFVGWAWDAGTAASGANNDGSINVTSGNQWVNDAAGLSITQYTGTQSAATVGHGLSEPPEFMLFKNLPDEENWIIYHQYIGAEKALYLNNTNFGEIDGTGWFNDTAPTDEVFSLGTATQGNSNNKAHICYAWRSIPGFSSFGSYTGNGNNAGPFVYTGFSPKWLMVRLAGENGNQFPTIDIKRDSSNPRTGQIYIDSDVPEATGTATRDKDIYSNGFRPVGTSAEHNGNNNNYIYAAFAEHPFKTARAK